MNAKLQEKYNNLKRIIEENGKDGVIIAFSGGVDSSTLTKISWDILGDKAIAVSGISDTYSQEELAESRKIAKEIGIKHQFVTTCETEKQEFIQNPENRCYYCKGELLDVLINLADKIGFKTVFEGTNASDLEGHRPGYKAIKERNRVISPWVEAGITKEEIREIAEEFHLSFYDKPASPCLASRVPFGERITKERLNRIEKAESAIKNITGIREIRVRDHGTIARIEVPKDDRYKLVAESIIDNIVARLKGLGYKYVTMDLEGFRSGSMLEGL
ncbi:MAG: ATP-dependent sacrificial sulfur transferase LarE [Candidatus Sigynarchaeota archaeon]